ncbi:hypothetical protein PBS_01980 [Paraburkholderia sp. 2C]
MVSIVVSAELEVPDETHAYDLDYSDRDQCGKVKRVQASKSRNKKMPGRIPVFDVSRCEYESTDRPKKLDSELPIFIKDSKDGVHRLFSAAMP